MTTHNKISIYCLMFFGALFFILQPLEAEAQRFGHRGGGGGRTMSRPTSRPSTRPATRPTTRPSTRPSNQSFSRPTSRPSTRPSGGSINGGSHSPSDRSFPKSNSVSDRMPNRDGSRDIKKNNINKTDVKNKVSGNTNISGNKVNVDRGDKNVNINVDNSKHVNIGSNNRVNNVRRNSLHYARPPYRYGGFHFYCYHPYYYHPFRPFYWGPYWHPWGFFVATLTATAIIISVENQKYHYDQGVYYVEGDGGYTVVKAPVGATIKVLPEGSETVEVNETTNNYYYGGTYYEKDDGGYTVVPPTAGSTVKSLPEGAEEVRMGDQTYVKYGDTYYQPVQVDGDDAYEVADVQAEDDDANASEEE